MNIDPNIRAAILADLKLRAEAEGPAQAILLSVLEMARQEAEEPTIHPLPLRPTIDVAAAAAALGDATDHQVQRDGDLDLSFGGWTIASVEHGTPERGGRLELLLTASGILVTSSCRWGLKGRAGTVCRAGTHTDPAAAVKWFRADGGGKLGASSKALWETACARLPQLAPWQTEMVD